MRTSPTGMRYTDGCEAWFLSRISVKSYGTQTTIIQMEQSIL